jgi:hypothetical protein
MVKYKSYKAAGIADAAGLKARWPQMVPILEANAKRRQYDTFDAVVKGIRRCLGAGLAVD